MIEDLLPIGSVLQAREALDGLSGKLIFAGGQTATLDLAWYARDGKKGDVIDSGTFQDAHISPDGKKVSAARADAGGHLEIDSAPGRGTSVRARLPLGAVSGP